MNVCILLPVGNKRVSSCDSDKINGHLQPNDDWSKPKGYGTHCAMIALKSARDVTLVCFALVMVVAHGFAPTLAHATKYLDAYGTGARLTLAAAVHTYAIRLVSASSGVPDVSATNADRSEPACLSSTCVVDKSVLTQAVVPPVGDMAEHKQAFQVFYPTGLDPGAAREPPRV